MRKTGIQKWNSECRRRGKTKSVRHAGPTPLRPCEGGAMTALVIVALLSLAMAHYLRNLIDKVRGCRDSGVRAVGLNRYEVPRQAGNRYGRGDLAYHVPTALGRHHPRHQITLLEQRSFVKGSPFGWISPKELQHQTQRPPHIFYLRFASPGLTILRLVILEGPLPRRRKEVSRDANRHDGNHPYDRAPSHMPIVNRKSQEARSGGTAMKGWLLLFGVALSNNVGVDFRN
jgi:hypothetical protein